MSSYLELKIVPCPIIQAKDCLIYIMTVVKIRNSGIQNCPNSLKRGGNVHFQKEILFL